MKIKLRETINEYPTITSVIQIQWKWRSHLHPHHLISLMPHLFNNATVEHIWLRILMYAINQFLGVPKQTNRVKWYFSMIFWWWWQPIRVFRHWHKIWAFFPRSCVRFSSPIYLSHVHLSRVNALSTSHG